MADIFIAYKREEAAKIAPLAARLEKLGLSVWYDLSVVPGEEFERRIAPEIALAKAVVVCWSPAAAQSEFVRNEASFAKREGRLLLPVLLETCSIPPQFSGLQSLDLRDWNGDPSDQRLSEVADKIASRFSQEVAPLIIRTRESDEGVWRSASAIGEPTLPILASFKPADDSSSTLYWPFDGSEAEVARFFQRQLHLSRTGTALVTFYGTEEAVSDEFDAHDHNETSLAPREIPSDWRSGAQSMRFEIRAPDGTLIIWCACGASEPYREAGVYVDVNKQQHLLTAILHLAAATHKGGYAAAVIRRAYDALTDKASPLALRRSRMLRQPQANDNNAEEYNPDEDSVPLLEEVPDEETES